MQSKVSPTRLGAECPGMTGQQVDIDDQALRQNRVREYFVCSIADNIAGAEVCSNMDQFTHYEDIYYKIATTVGKDV